MRLRRAIGIGLGGLALAGAAVMGIGALLPAEHLASGSTIVAAPPERVAAMVRDVEAHPSWRGSVDGVEIHRRNGPEIDYSETSGGDRIRFRLVETEPNRRFVSTIADDSLPFGGSWTIALAPAAGGTTVTIEERGIVRNPLFRFVSAVIIGHEAGLRTYLDDLARAAPR
jgi:uncharacterized protein YndB with AHSA1/START domain